MRVTDIGDDTVRLDLIADEMLAHLIGPGTFIAAKTAGLIVWDEIVSRGIVPTVDLAAYTSAAHAALRDGGVTVGGMRIKTDSESRGLIDGAYALSQAQPDKTIDFKAASGWVAIDSQTMQTVAIAVGQWVQACYSAYRQIDGKVTDGTFTTAAQVDAAFAAVTLPA